MRYSIFGKAASCRVPGASSESSSALHSRVLLVAHSKIERDVIALGVFISLADLRRRFVKYIRHHNKIPTTNEFQLLRRAWHSLCEASTYIPADSSDVCSPRQLRHVLTVSELAFGKMPCPNNHA
jgi:hypothetical protein